MSEKSEERKYVNDIAISARVRIARNLKGLPFPNKATKETGKKVQEKIVDSISQRSEIMNNNMKYISINEISDVERISMVENHLISPNLGNNYFSGAIISKDNIISVMINEEDHARIQAFETGFELKKAFESAKRIDILMGETLEYAYNDKYGYLTSCPTNLGNAVRGSVMLHLPATVLSNRMKPVLDAASQYRLTIRGIYGEGSQAIGDLFQISNQNSLGLSEKEVLDSIHAVSKEIIKQERALRYRLLKDDEIVLKDKIFRAYGTLKYSYAISAQESMQLLSLLRMGIDLDLIKGVAPETMADLMKDIQPATLSIKAGKDLTEKERDITRAEYIRDKLNG